MARTRSLNVCDSCHARKVRCDLQATSPCTNCCERNLTCTAYARKPYITTKRVRRNARTPTPSDTASPHPPLAHQIKVVEAIVRKPSSRKTTIYAGKSGYGTLLDIMGGTRSTTRRIQIPGPLPANLPPDDLSYLQAKGCFDLPSHSMDLVEAYLSFVHPTFPILDAQWLSSTLATEDGLNTISLLLVWSIFSVSSAYLPEYAASSVRSTFFTKGKLLFHLAGEDDKIVLIQAALLLSFWYDDGNDAKQSWYWSGIAFTVAQELGLDQESGGDPGGMNPGVIGRLWECCLMRDAWLSYSMGRSLRVHKRSGEARSTAATPTHLKGLKVGTRTVDFGREERVVGRAWEALVDVADILRDALSPSAPSKSILSRCLGSVSKELGSLICGSASPAVLMSMRHAQLALHGAIIAVYYLHGAVDQKDAVKSATSTLTVLGSCIDGTQLAFVPPSVITLIMPALLVFAARLKAAEGTEKNSSRTMELALGYLDQLQSTYPAASIVRRLFSTMIVSDEA